MSRNPEMEEETTGSADPRPLEVPARRIQALRRIGARLLAAQRVVLTTHVNADGDGTGSEVAVASWLARRGVRTTIVNPTPYPEAFRFILEPGMEVLDWGAPGADHALDAADLLLVLDTGEPSRIGALAPIVPRDRTLVIDHHPPGSEAVASDGLVDPTAAATGELVYDLVTIHGDEFPPAALLGIYVAVVTDTGSFRFSNTTPRTHAIAGDLLRRGIDPEKVYQQLFATVPKRRIELLREALATLDTDPAFGLTWIVVTRDLIQRLGATAEDLDGIVDHARSLEGTEVALLFRETDDGRTKVSFRSSGVTDVNRLARLFGGGGHVKASGATVDGAPDAVVPRVLEVIRREMGAGQH